MKAKEEYASPVDVARALKKCISDNPIIAQITRARDKKRETDRSTVSDCDYVITNQMVLIDKIKAKDVFGIVLTVLCLFIAISIGVTLAIVGTPVYEKTNKLHMVLPPILILPGLIVSWWIRKLNDWIEHYNVCANGTMDYYCLVQEFLLRFGSGPLRELSDVKVQLDMFLIGIKELERERQPGGGNECVGRLMNIAGTTKLFRLTEIKGEFVKMVQLVNALGISTDDVEAHYRRLNEAMDATRTPGKSLSQLG